MEIQDRNLLNEFILEILPITWNMVTSCLPVISSCKYDQKDVEAGGLVCTLPALHMCFDPDPKQSAAFLSRDPLPSCKKRKYEQWWI